MVLINMDVVYEVTILLCGLQKGREAERERRRERETWSGWG